MAAPLVLNRREMIYVIFVIDIIFRYHSAREFEEVFRLYLAYTGNPVPWQAFRLPVNAAWAMPVTGTQSVTQVGIAKTGTVECQHCHRLNDLKAFQDAWLKTYQSSFLFLWLHRLARKGGRNLVGEAFDSILPFPEHWKRKLSVRLRPRVIQLQKNLLEYPEIVRRFASGKPVGLSEYFQKTILNLRLEGTLVRFQNGQVYLGLTRLSLVGLTCYDVGKYGWQAYQHPDEREKNLKKCLRQAIKWTIGTEIGNIGFDIGAYLAHKGRDRFVIAFLLDALFSAVFDLILLKYFKIEN